MLVNSDQKAVFLLAHIVLRNNKLSIPALLSGQAIHYKKGSHPDILDWAINYIQCYPNDPFDQELLHHMHLDPGYQWTPEQTRRVSVGVKSFYAKLNDSRKYAIGLKWLNSGGRAMIENYAIAQYAPPPQPAQRLKMKYSNVYINSINYELPPVVVSSAELEQQLEPLYTSLHISPGQLQALTGIRERRWWLPNTSLSQGAAAAGRKALAAGNVSASDIGAIVYTGVCRELFEPATACRVADQLGINGDVMINDISNACLGVMNGILDIANRIELGQIRAGLVVSCESARELNETTIRRMLAENNMAYFARSIATLTGGSGAVAVLLTDNSFNSPQSHRLLGGAAMAQPQHHELCRWGVEPHGQDQLRQFMNTDAVAVMQHGVALGKKTWQLFQNTLNWTTEHVDRVICHQVGSAHQSAILNELGISQDKDFSTFPFLGNIGTVSLPITAAIAAERAVLKAGDRVAMLGIGSGLNCMMLGVEW